MNSDRMICSVMLALFRRKGGDGKCVRSIDGWSDDFFSRFALDEDELPVIFGYPREACEFLISTRHLFACDRKIEFDEISGVNPHMLGVHSASARESLDVVLKSNDIVVVRTGPGNPFFGVWSVLIYAANSLGSKKQGSE